MTGTDSNSQPMSTTMVETSNVASSSMFATSPEAHLYGGPSIPPGYQSLSGTFLVWLPVLGPLPCHPIQEFHLVLLL
jgi:hypothetical protein